LLKESTGKLISKWIQDVKPTEEKEMNESNLTEAPIQPNGTDKIDTKTSEPTSEVGKFPEKTVKKGMITFYNYTKAQKIKEQEEHSMSDNKKDNESDHDYENQIKVTGIDQSEVGHTLVKAGGQDNLRRRKVKYHLGEQHGSVAENITPDPKSNEVAKANLMAKHAQEKESLANKQKSERERLKESSTTPVYDTHIKGQSNYSDIAKKHGTSKTKEIIHHLTKERDSLRKHSGEWAGPAHLKSHDFAIRGLRKAIGEEIEFEDDICEECEKSPCVCDDKSIDQTQLKPTFDPFFKEEELEERAKIRKKFINGQWIIDLKNTVDEKYDQTIEVATPNTPIETSEEDDIDDKEIEAMIGNLSDEEIMDEYGEDELGLVDDETGEEIPKLPEEDALDEQAIMEVLSRIERMKAKFRIRRTAAKRERATKIALKRYSNTATINKRARRLAIKLMKQRLLRGRDVSKLSVGEKERIERTLEQRKALIGRIATRLAPRVRKVEKARMSHSKFTQGSQPSVF
jgi:hypothetical protein